MAIVLDGTAGITTPEITSAGGPLVVNASAPDNSVVVDASGNVGMGTGLPAAQLHVNRVGDGTFATTLAESRTKAGFILNPESSSSSFGLNISKAADGAGIIYQPTNSAGTTASNNIFNPFGGNLLVGTTSGIVAGSDGCQFNTSGIATGRNSTSSRVHHAFFNPNGQVGSISTSASSTTYSTSSDYRLKHDIQPMTGALAKVQALKPVTYKWKADGSDGEGFIAHELAEVCPSAVTGEKDAVDAEGNPVYQGIDTSFLVATLTAAIQEQQALIESLTARVVALEGQAT